MNVKLWLAVAVFLGWTGAVLYAGWRIWGQLPVTIIKEVHHRDTLLRSDTVEIVPPVFLSKMRNLQDRIAGFLLNTTKQGIDTCIILLTASQNAFDSLRQALLIKPGIKLVLSDSIKFKNPIVALRTTIRYIAEGDSAFSDWGYRFGETKPSPKSNFGMVFSLTNGGDYFYGGQLRISRSAALQVGKGKTTWLFGATYFLF